MRIRYCSSDVCSSDLPSRGEELGGTEGAWSRVDDASLIHRELTASGSARYVSAVLAQIRGIYLDLQLKLAVRRYGELAAAGEGFPGIATRQFHVQAAGNYVHDFQLGGAELVFTWRHITEERRVG